MKKIILLLATIFLLIIENSVAFMPFSTESFVCIILNKCALTNRIIHIQINATEEKDEKIVLKENISKYSVQYLNYENSSALELNNSNSNITSLESEKNRTSTTLNSVQARISLIIER